MHPVLKQGLFEWRSQTHYGRAEDFVFPSHRSKGPKPLDLAEVLRHTVGTMLAEMANTSSRFATTWATATWQARSG